MLEIIENFKDLNLMAERLGFEPRKERPLAGFQDRCFQPLSHLSESKVYKYNFEIQLKTQKIILKIMCFVIV